MKLMTCAMFIRMTRTYIHETTYESVEVLEVVRKDFLIPRLKGLREGRGEDRLR